MASIIAENAQQSLIADSNYVVEFDIERGTCYLWCFYSAVSYCLGVVCYPCARKMMTTQQVTFEDRRLNYKFDSWFVRVDKMVPYDRIQDVNITENCFQRCCGVHSVSIQTAGGGQIPEVIIIAPKNPEALRDQIIAHRDGIVHGAASISHTSNDDGTGASRAGTTKSPMASASNSQELVEINRTLQRIEKLMQAGLTKMEIK